MEELEKDKALNTVIKPTTGVVMSTRAYRLTYLGLSGSSHVEKQKLG